MDSNDDYLFDEFMDMSDKQLQELVDNSNQQGAGPVDPVDEHLIVEPAGRRYSKKYKVDVNRFKVTLRDPQNVPIPDVPHFIHNTLDFILRRVTDTAEPHDRIRICIDAKSLKYPIWTPPIPKNQLSVDRWMTEVERVLNSNEEIRLQDGMTVMVQIANVVSGSCSYHVPDRILKKLKRLQCVVQVFNEKDHMCLPRCFILASKLARFGERSEEYKEVCKRRTTQRILAKQLLGELDLTDREMTLDDIPKFCQAFPDFRIRVISLEQNNAIVFDNHAKQKKEINLLHYSHHFAVLKSLKAFFKSSYYCTGCNKA